MVLLGVVVVVQGNLTRRGYALKFRSLLRLSQRARAGGAGMQVEGGAGDQDVKLQPQHAGRLPFLDAVDRGIADLGSIDDGHAPATLDFDGLVRTYDGGGVLVEADADGEGV